MSYNFKSADRDTPYLMPPSLSDWLPEGHLAWFIVAAVKKLDLSAFRGRYRADGLGASAYDPELMVGLMLYAYCLGERSSRKIEEACAVDVAYRVIMGNLIPDYSTICRFRAEHEKDLKGLFKQVLRMCARAGMVKAGMVVLDGTKMKASAAKSANRSYDHLQAEIDRMFEEAKRKDAEEDELYGKDRRGNEMPEHINTREKQAKWIEAEMENIKREAAEEAARQAEKIARREAEEAATGEKKRGRKPSPPNPEPAAEEKVNLTDPDSRLMKTREGYVQGYNAQAAVTKEQMIVAEEVTQDRNDVKRLHPMLEKAAEELEDAGIEEEIDNVLADAGYWSQANDEKADPAGPELFIATNKDWKQRKALREAPPPRGRMRKDMTARDRMERKLLTQRGRALYKLRGQTVEPVFGQVKDARGIDRFMRRGMSAVASEWSLICTTHNILKLWRSGKAKMERISERMKAGASTFTPVYA
jgi:transposase